MNEENEDNEPDNENVSEVIIGLKSGYPTTKWIFPETKICPNIKCQRVFRTRSAAISHFKCHHADLMVVCRVCSKPILASSIPLHFFNVHPNRTPPVPNARKFVAASKTSHLHDRYIVTLGNSRTNSKWEFPETSKCPVNGCRKQYTNRKNAMMHYQNVHAPFSNLCAICKRPFLSEFYLQHHITQHQTVPLPANLKQILVRPQCTHCNKYLCNRLTLSKHMSKIHNEGRLECTFKNCGKRVQFLFELKKHWREQHGHLRFPGAVQTDRRKSRQTAFKTSVHQCNRVENDVVSSASTTSSIGIDSSQLDQNNIRKRISNARKTATKPSISSDVTHRVIEDKKLCSPCSVPVERLSHPDIEKWLSQVSVAQQDNPSTVSPGPSTDGNEWNNVVFIKEEPVDYYDHVICINDIEESEEDQVEPDIDDDVIIIDDF